MAELLRTFLEGSASLLVRMFVIVIPIMVVLELLERHPSIKLALHYTGSLRDWLAVNQSTFLARVRALVARGQIEVMTGGYYEPILAAIPDVDKRGQIEKLTYAVKSDFGYDARGMWLAERV